MMNRDNTVYSRRRAYMSSASPGYLRMSMSGSRDSVDDDQDDASSDAGSVRSTASTRSYKSWRRSHSRKRRSAKLERAQSLFGDSTTEHTNLHMNRNNIDPLSFSLRRTPVTAPRPKSAEEVVSRKLLDSSSSVDSEALRHVPNERDVNGDAFKELSTIVQSPLEAFYSSSSLDTSSDDDTDQLQDVRALREAEIQKETRDWLISRSFDNDPTNQHSKVVSHAQIIAKTDDKPSRILSRAYGGGTGLNELLDIAEAEPFNPEDEVDIEKGQKSEAADAVSVTRQTVEAAESSERNEEGESPAFDQEDSAAEEQGLLIENPEITREKDSSLDSSLVTEVTSIEEEEIKEELILNEISGESNAAINSERMSHSSTLASGGDIAISTPHDAEPPSFDQSAILRSTAERSPDGDPEDPRASPSDDSEKNRYNVVADVTIESNFAPRDLPSIKENDETSPLSEVSCAAMECEPDVFSTPDAQVESGEEYTLKDLSLPSDLNGTGLSAGLVEVKQATEKSAPKTTDQLDDRATSVQTAEGGAFSEKLSEIRRDVSENGFFVSNKKEKSNEKLSLENGLSIEHLDSDLAAADPVEEMLLRDEERAPNPPSCPGCAQILKDKAEEDQTLQEEEQQDEQQGEEQETELICEQPSHSNGDRQTKENSPATTGDESQFCCCCHIM